MKKSMRRREKALQKQEEMIGKLFLNGVASGAELERFKEAVKLTELDCDTLL